MDIKSLEALYRGFIIHEPLGNNAFSFQDRTHQEIYVPPLITGNLTELTLGEQVVFSEVDDGKEINRRGLKCFLHLPIADKTIFVFDNHNHAFFFWSAAIKAGKLTKGLPLVHIDQHTDMRIPERMLSPETFDAMDIPELFQYTNYDLNVGNFIQPALAAGLFSGVEIIDHAAAFDRSFEEASVLDIDVDIFSDDMAYIPADNKMTFIKDCIRSANIITVATSPYFIDQETAISLVKMMFDDLV